MIQLRIMTQEEVDECNAAVKAGGEYFLDDITDCLHDWQPINTPRGRAYQCEKCWDRTD